MSERRMWPTPCAQDDNKTPAAHMAMKARMKGGARRTITSLQVMAKAEAIGFAVVTPASSQLTLFAEAFPVSPTPWLASVPAPQTTATSGRTSPDSFASVNPDGSWRKTCQGYSQVTLDGFLEPFSETWPRAGMTRNGTAYRLPPSAPLTDATASGLWPTPDVVSAVHHGMVATSGGQIHLPQAVNAAMWPTASARDWKDSPGMATTSTNPDGSTRQRTDQLARAVYSSPTVRDANTLAKVSRGRGSLAAGNEWVQPLPVQVGGSLNPTWVEWLMGYPLGWTALKASATPSSRRSPNGSRTGSER